MKKFSIVLIVLGLLIIAYPFLDSAYSLYLETRLIMDWDVDLDETDLSTTSTNDYVELQAILEEGNDDSLIPVETDTVDLDNIQPIEETNNPNEAEIEEATTPKPTKSPQLKTLGMISIGKIELKIPILDGTSKTNLRVGAGQIFGTTKLGEIGNSALAAHRSHTYGRMFNRLDELEIGDKIIVETKDGTFEYTVYKKHVVEPTDISVLNRNKKDRVLTLITCTPLYTATHRLIIHAVLL